MVVVTLILFEAAGILSIQALWLWDFVATSITTDLFNSSSISSWLVSLPYMINSSVFLENTIDLKCILCNFTIVYQCAHCENKITHSFWYITQFQWKFWS